MTPARSPWWARHLHADRRGLLLARNRIRDALRSWFAERGFVEVECDALQVSPGNEAHLHAFATERLAPDGRRMPLYLHTSPEFACKKLLAAGETKIFSFGPVFRNRETGPLHAPEFTMLEWYRAEENYDSVIADCAAILRIATEAAGAARLSFRGQEADPFAPLERLSVADAFNRYAEIDLLSTLNDNGGAKRASLAEQARRAQVSVASDDSWSDIFSRILVQHVEKKLGLGSVTCLDRYPRAEAALARRSTDDARVAERFEIYACGVELANGFGELTDAAEQRTRFEAEMQEKARVYGETYPIDEDFLAALRQMPLASGVALGFDRLVMLATGAPDIRQVRWTPAPELDA